MSPQIDVQFAVTGPELPAEQLLQRWALAVLTEGDDRAQVTIRIVDEREGTDLNHTFRNGEHATNVLCFPFEVPDVVNLPLLGDVVICAPVVAREALAQSKPAPAHWAHMVVHGVLHLLGYDHEVSADAEVMEQRERAILASLGFADPYQFIEKGALTGCSEVADSAVATE